MFDPSLGHAYASITTPILLLLLVLQHVYVRRLHRAILGIIDNVDIAVMVLLRKIEEAEKLNTENEDV
jgi:hypothetical protein